jgi:hypothetical protein
MGICNNGFWDLDPEERARIKDDICEQNGVVDFYDLPPEERARAYDRASRQSGMEHDYYR